MIQFHYFPGEIPQDTSYMGDVNLWGSIEDGEIVTSNPDKGPRDTDFETYITELNGKLLSGVIDPIAVIKHTENAHIQAVVPSKDDTESVFGGADLKSVIKNGLLGVVEQYEVNKYFTRSSKNNSQSVYKDYELNDDYQTLVVNWRTNTNMHPLGEINIPDREVVQITKGKEKAFKTELEHLLSHAPNLNPVKILQLNSQTRLCGVKSIVDDGEIWLQPSEIKKDPEKIREEVA